MKEDVLQVNLHWAGLGWLNAMGGLNWDDCRRRQLPSGGGGLERKDPGVRTF
jgi:hypothetical protein